MTKRKLICLFAALGAFVCTPLRAQNFTMYNFGESELTRLNPASTIKDGNQAYVAYKHSWSYSAVYGEKPYDVEVGGALNFRWGAISAAVDYDGYSFFERHELRLNYAYQWKLKDRCHSTLAVGGGLDLSFNDIDFNKLGYAGVLSGSDTYCTPDINLGIEYTNDHIRTGLGMTNLIATNLKFDENAEDQDPPKVNSNGAELVRNPRVILAYFIYRFDIGKVGLSPLIFGGYVERAEVKVGLRVDYGRWVAFTYSFRAMEMSHICTLNLDIPKTPITLDVSYTKCAFYNDQTLSAALRFHW